jgi:hypothetical protein
VYGEWWVQRGGGPCTPSGTVPGYGYPVQHRAEQDELPDPHGIVVQDVVTTVVDHAVVRPGGGPTNILLHELSVRSPRV